MNVSVVGTGGEWDDYVSIHPEATVDHLWHWRDVFTDVFGHECRYLVARRDGRLVGVLPLVLFRSLLFGRAVVSVPFLNDGGVVADDDDAARALVAEAVLVAKAFGAAHLELRHRRQMFGDAPVRQHKVAFSRGLAATPETLWQDTDRKVRNQVRKAEKEGLTAVPPEGADGVSAFYAVFARNMRDLGTPVYPRRMFDVVVDRFRDRARVFRVERDGQTMAAAIALRFRDTVVVPWASSLREFRQLCPNMLLYWALLEQATREGARTFDFGRSSPESGAAQFKRQWGATETPLFWEYPYLTGDAVPDHGPANPKFQAAIALWKRCPLWFTNALGPRLVRAIP